MGLKFVGLRSVADRPGFGDKVEALKQSGPKLSGFGPNSGDQGFANFFGREFQHSPGQVVSLVADLVVDYGQTQAGQRVVNHFAFPRYFDRKVFPTQ